MDKNNTALNITFYTFAESSILLLYNGFIGDKYYFNFKIYIDLIK